MVKQELTAADVWAMLATLAKRQEETDRQLKEIAMRSAEAEKRRAEAEKQRAETERQRAEAAKRRIEEMEKEKLEREKREKEMEEKREKERLERIEANRLFDERMARYNRHLGYFGESLGSVVELILVPCIREKMNAFGHNFTRMGPNKIYDRHNKKTLTEIDLLLENCEEAMAIEIKTDLSVKWVNRHLDRLSLLRKNEDITGLKGRILYGAVAGITIDEDARELALEKGLYVLHMKEDEERLEVMVPKREAGRW